MPNVALINGVSKQHINNGWIHAQAEEVPVLREHTRIHEVWKMASGSSPLGIGQSKAQDTELRIPIENACDLSQWQSLTLHSLVLTETQHGSCRKDLVSNSSVKFVCSFNTENSVRIALSLRYDFQFISAQPCRLPHVDARLEVSEETEHLFGHGDDGVVYPSSIISLAQYFQIYQQSPRGPVWLCASTQSHTSAGRNLGFGCERMFRQANVCESLVRTSWSSLFGGKNGQDLPQLWCERSEGNRCRNCDTCWFTIAVVSLQNNGASNYQEWWKREPTCFRGY